MKKIILILLGLFLSHVGANAYKLTSFIPRENPTGTGIIVCPGGSYFWLDTETEGVNVAKWLCQNGIAAFVLEYSHGGWAAFAYHVRPKGRSFPAGFNDLRSALDSINQKRSNRVYGVFCRRAFGYACSRTACGYI